MSNGKEFDFTQEYDEIKSFEEESQAYDEDYFEDKTLFLIYVPSNSGSLRYGVNSIYSKDEYFSVHIEQINNPEIFTDDMVWWFITFGVDKSIIEDKEYFDADLNNF